VLKGSYKKTKRKSGGQKEGLNRVTKEMKYILRQRFPEILRFGSSRTKNFPRIQRSNVTFKTRKKKAKVDAT